MKNIDSKKHLGWNFRCHIGCLATLLFAFMMSACGGDSSSNAESLGVSSSDSEINSSAGAEGIDSDTSSEYLLSSSSRQIIELPTSVASVADLSALECFADLKGKVVYVNDLDDDFVCDGEQFVNPLDFVTDEFHVLNDVAGEFDVVECGFSRKGGVVTVIFAGEEFYENMSLAVNQGDITKKIHIIGKRLADKYADLCQNKNDDNDIYAIMCDDSILSFNQVYRNAAISGTEDLDPASELMCHTLLKSEGLSGERSIYNASANTLTDLRDGSVYRTTTIAPAGSDYSEVWMAENLKFKTVNSYCGFNDPSSCDSDGRLYTWAAAMGKSDLECGVGKYCDFGDTDVRGLCPMGWHIPSASEWKALSKALGELTAGAQLKSTTGWDEYNGTDVNGTDDYSFSAYPDYSRSDEGRFYGKGEGTSFWSSNEFTHSIDTTQYAHVMALNSDDEILMSMGTKSFAFRVRCLKD